MKRLILTIDVDTTVMTISRTETQDPNNIHIVIGADVALMAPDGSAAYLPVISHEIGHAVAVWLGLQSSESPTDHSELMKAEKQAWKIGQQVFKNTRDYALSTYERKEGN